VNRFIHVVAVFAAMTFVSPGFASDDPKPEPQSAPAHSIVENARPRIASDSTTQNRIAKFNSTGTPTDASLLEDTSGNLFFLTAGGMLYLWPDNSGPFIQNDGTGGITLYGKGGGTIKLVNADTLVKGLTGNGSSNPVLHVKNSNDASLLYVAGTGNIGAGTYNPVNRLHVFSTVNADGVTVDGTTNPAVSFRNAGTVQGYLGLATTAAAYLPGTASGDLVLRSETGNIAFGRSGQPSQGVMVVGSSMGIGVSVPLAPLHASGIIRSDNRYESRYGGSDTVGSGASMFLGDASSLWAGMQLSANKDLQFWMDDANTGWNTPRMTLKANGNVGIGTTNPGVRLDVLGTAAVYGGARRVMRVWDDSTMAAGVGGGIDFAGKFDTAGNYTQYANIKGVKSNATSGDQSGKAVLSVDNSQGSVIEIATVDMSGLAVTGNITATGNITGAQVIGAVYQDVAEWVPATTKMAPGTVVVLNRERTNEVMPSAHAYDTAVAGVVSTQPGLILGVGSDSKAQIATTGRVKVHVDATAGAIGIGDLLVTSDKQGTAMKSQPVDLGGVQFHRPGTVIGKALQPLPNGEGDILVLLSLQ